MCHRHALLITLIASLLSSPGPTVAGPPTPSAANAPTGDTAALAAVNINTASVQELMTLSGIGRSVAEKIVDYRQTHGPFKKPEELRRVQGVGAGLWERNRDRIIVK